MRRGENIYKRKDGRWEARYSKGRNHEGRIIYGSCYGKTYSEAKSKAHTAQMEYTHDSPLRRKNDAPPFGEICDDWLQMRQLQLKQSTYMKYQATIEKYIKPAMEKRTLSEITTEKIQDFSCYLISARNLSSKTAQDILVLLHSIIKFGRKRYPGQYTAVEIMYPRQRPREMRVLSRTEQKRLTDSLMEGLCPCKMGVLLALWTGIRIGELCALQWKHIDLQEHTIQIEATMQRIRQNDPGSPGKTTIVIDAPKTASAARTIPLSAFALELCQKVVQENRNAYILTGAENYMEPRLLQYHFRRYALDCELQGVTFHTLRHTFATRCVEAGFDIKSLSEILGHSNISITLNRYVHCSMDLKRKNIKKLETLDP